MNDAQRAFTLFLINQFSLDLHGDLERYAQRLGQAIAEDNPRDYDTYNPLLQKTREVYIDMEGDETAFLRDWIKAILQYEGDKE